MTNEYIELLYKIRLFYDILAWKLEHLEFHSVTLSNDQRSLLQKEKSLDYYNLIYEYDNLFEKFMKQSNGTYNNSFK